MKIRMIETMLSSTPAHPNSGPQAPICSPAPRSSLALLEILGPRCAAIAVVMMTVVLFLTAWFAPDSPGTSSSSAWNRYSGWGCPPGKTLCWYVRDGQWKADARTAAAMLRYVLTPEFDPRIPPIVPQSTPFLSATTNSGTNVPKV